MSEINRQGPSQDEVLRNLMLDEQRENRAYRGNRALYDYQTFLDIDISDLADQSLSKRGSFRWYDMCCGKFNAGLSFMRSARNILDTSRIEVRGIDINTEHEEDILTKDGTVISHGNVVAYPMPVEGVDLITCVEGLYLIDKHMGFASVLQALENWYSGLRVGGLLATQNIAILQGYGRPLHVLDYLRRWANKTGNNIEYDMGGKEGHRRDDYRYIKITKATASELHFPAIGENDPPIIAVDPDPDIDEWWSKFD